jgi:hypothetical protein
VPEKRRRESNLVGTAPGSYKPKGLLIKSTEVRTWKIWNQVSFNLNKNSRSSLEIESTRQKTGRGNPEKLDCTAEEGETRELTESNQARRKKGKREKRERHFVRKGNRFIKRTAERFCLKQQGRNARG